VNQADPRVSAAPPRAPATLKEALLAGELLPPPDLAPPVPHDTTPEERVRMWVDLVNACEQFLLAGLRREIGPDGDLQAAYQRWYRQQREEHERTVIHMLSEFQRRLGGGG
jgi:hypothetical protein